ncbi:MAG: hypothetical protein A2046_17200 [Bacteroidetes bacterium GWA2_30_7]|nr:MAG: hypothetical protein A2046_17200 [Bacteroidetes bacterium GWA2_30_7]
MNILEKCCFSNQKAKHFENALLLNTNQLLQYGYEYEKVDSIKPIIKEDGRIEEKYMLLPVEIEERKFAEANQLLDEIKVNEDDTLSDFVKEQEIKLALRTENKTYFEMDALQMQTIEGIVNENPEITYNSKVILKHIKGKKYEKKPIIESDNANKNLTINRNKHIENETVIDKYFNIYPNPTSETVNFEINQIVEYVNDKLIISDMLGRTIKEIDVDNTIITLNTNQLQNGIYYAFIVTDKVIVSKKKFTILK